MLATLLVASIVSVNLFPPIQFPPPQQDFLMAPIPPKVCIGVGLNRMQHMANSVILFGGGVSGGALTGFVGGHFDSIAEQTQIRLISIMEGSIARSLLDIIPVGLRSAC